MPLALFAVDFFPGCMLVVITKTLALWRWLVHRQWPADETRQDMVFDGLGGRPRGQLLFPLEVPLRL